jgi:glycosyltransferase involved in cell wall biosynthesis
MKEANQENSKPIIRNIAIVVPPYKNPDDVAPQMRPLRFAAVLAPLAKEVFIITGNFRANIPYDNVKVINVKAPIAKTLKESLISRGFRFLSAQFTLTGAIIRLFLKVDINPNVVFFFGGEAFLIPMMICKLLRRKIVLVPRGSLKKEEQVRKNPFYKVLGGLRRLDLTLSDRIIVYSKGLIKEWDLERYQSKILIAPYLFVDSEKFRPETPAMEKENIIAYIGRLDSEKGILNFVQAMPGLLGTRNDITALIIGDGQLRDEAVQYLKQKNLSDRVIFVGWVTYDDIPDYFNKLKLVVLPSYTEGLPNVVQEAMACGTPVLATPVGAIPDLIKDGETGFIMEDNSAECIARNVIRALNHAQLEKIARNARTLVEKEFTYRAAVERYRTILASSNWKR